MAINLDALSTQVDAVVAKVQAGASVQAELTQAKADIAALQADAQAAQTKIDELTAKLAAA